MSGLIFAGIGKGIADAGTTFASYMSKGIEAERQAQLEEIRQERLLARDEARADRKVKDDEAKSEREAQERMDISAKASKRADEMATTRFEAPLSRDAATLAKSSEQAGADGDVALSEGQLKEMMRNDPKLRESYKQSGLIGGAIASGVDPRLQRATDEEQAVRELGGKASFVEAYAKAKKDTLAQIAQENKDARDKADRDLNIRREDRRDREGQDRFALGERRAEIADKRADAAMVSANRPTAERGSKQERMTSIINSANATIKSLDDGPRGKTQAERDKWQEQRDVAVDMRNNAQQQLKRIFEDDGKEPDSKPKAKNSDNAKAAATVSALPKGATQIGTSGGKPVYQTPDGKKFIGN